MNIVLPALAVSFAAFCVWLSVRVINRRERWAKWTLVAVLGVPVLYVASFGPWCRIASRNGLNRKIPIAYRPIIAAARPNAQARGAVEWYATLLTPANWTILWFSNIDGMPVWLWRVFET